MSTAEMATTFRRAAEVIRTGGLAQGLYERDDAHCTVGALMVAQGVEMWNVMTVKSEISYLADLLGGVDKQALRSAMPGSNVVAVWNDDASRTADDVASFLDQAAEKLEADL